VPLTELAVDTVRRIESVLEPELPAVNPLDAWSRGGESAGDIMRECFAVMMQDPAAAIGAVVQDRGPDGVIYPSHVSYMEAAAAACGKPVALVSARQGTGSDPLVASTTHRGMPVLDGVLPFLKGVRGLMDYRDFLARPEPELPAVDDAVIGRWSAQLRQGGILDELTSLAMLSDFGIPASKGRLLNSEAELADCAAALDFPLVLKTAMPGVHHKTEQRGVVLNIADPQQLRHEYRVMRERLGPTAVIAEMVARGTEMILGARRDPQFGPVVMLGFGGVLAEVMKDVAFALPPFDAATASRLLDKLDLRPLLDGVRGAPAADVEAFCKLAARFSAMVAALAHDVGEIDINPVIVTESNALAVDALVVCAGVGPDA
jgi:acyl-CoA synthetase (NDP forming)